MYQEEETGFEVGNASLDVIDGSRNKDEPRVKLDKIVLFCSRQKTHYIPSPERRSHTQGICELLPNTETKLIYKNVSTPAKRGHH